MNRVGRRRFRASKQPICSAGCRGGPVPRVLLRPALCLGPQSCFKVNVPGGELRGLGEGGQLASERPPRGRLLEAALEALEAVSWVRFDANPAQAAQIKVQGIGLATEDRRGWETLV